MDMKIDRNARHKWLSKVLLMLALLQLTCYFSMLSVFKQLLLKASRGVNASHPSRPGSLVWDSS